MLKIQGPAPTGTLTDGPCAAAASRLDLRPSRKPISKHAIIRRHASGKSTHKGIASNKPTFDIAIFVAGNRPRSCIEKIYLELLR